MKSELIDPVADLRGGAPGVCPLTVQTFLNSMQFFGKFDKIIGWIHPWINHIFWSDIYFQIGNDLLILFDDADNVSNCKMNLI